MEMYKIDAIRMPKEASGLPEDTYLLLVFASNAQYAFLSNGRRYNYRRWKSLANVTEKIFITKEEYIAIIDGKNYFAPGTSYKNEGRLSVARYKEIILDAFDKAKTVEEVGEIKLAGISTCKTSRDLYLMCMDFFIGNTLYFQKSDSDMDEDYIKYLLQPFFVVRLSDGTYLGERPEVKRITLSVHQALQSLTENEALEKSDDFLRIVGDSGYEIIRIDAVDRAEAIECLKLVH